MSRPAVRGTPLRVLAGSGAFLLGQALSTVAFALLALILAPAPYRIRYGIITGWTHFNLWWLRTCCGLRHEVEGQEHLGTTPGVVLCKHESAWETLALQTIFRPQSWVLKRELLRIPFFGWGLALLRPIAIDRAQGRDAVRELIRQGRDRLARGAWIVVFPEGTRVAPGTTRPYHKGGAVLAKRLGVPVTPVAHDAGDFWPRRSFLKYPGTIRLCIGPPIHPEGMSPEDITRTASHWIEARVSALRAPPPPDTPSGTPSPHPSAGNDG